MTWSASADVETVASSYGLTRALPYANALVANPAGFNPKAFSVLTDDPPGARRSTRVYIGDVHGRVWKFLTARPDVAIPRGRPRRGPAGGPAVSLLGDAAPGPTRAGPALRVRDVGRRRSPGDGPFRIFGFIDKGADVTGHFRRDHRLDAGERHPDLPAVEPLFERNFDQGDPEVDCGYTTEAVFRGTVQPATAFECDDIVATP